MSFSNVSNFSSFGFSLYTQTRATRHAPAAQTQGTRRSPRLATLAPDAGGQPAAAAQMANAGAHAPRAPHRRARYSTGVTRTKGRAWPTPYSLTTTQIAWPPRAPAKGTYGM